MVFSNMLMLSSMVLNSILTISENLTKEAYSGNYRNRISPISNSANILNPQMNLETLKNRLFVVDYYRNLHGVQNAYWAHYFLKRAGNHIYKYKFAFALKSLLVYNIYRDARNFQYRNTTEFLGTNEQFELVSNIGYSGLVATLALLYI